MNTRRPRAWLRWKWGATWSWLERIIVAAAALTPIIAITTLMCGGLGWSCFAGCVMLGALALLNFVAYRHGGGWRLLGPHFFYDIVRLARRGQSTRLRVAYLMALFIGLAYTYHETHVPRVGDPNEFARLSERFSYVLFLVQNLAVVILTPVYLASAIAQEKERRTLDLLFTTQLSDAEIVLGILFSRIIHLAGFVLAGIPILCVIQFWGGIDIVLLAGNLANTLLNILTVGSLSLFISTVTKSSARAVMATYAILLPAGMCCLGAWGGLLVLQDSRTGAHGATVQNLGLIALPHVVISAVCLGLAILYLRDEPGISVAPVWAPPDWPEPAREAWQKAREAFHSQPRPRPAEQPDRLDTFSIPYVLPPVSENPLVWKERFLGGPALASAPVLAVSTSIFFGTWFALLLNLFFDGLVMDWEKHLNLLSKACDVLRILYYVFLACYGLGVAFRAAGSVARERQQQTLEPLLLLPVERSEILFAKWLGSLWRGWAWMALLQIDVVVGLILGGYHPFSAVLLSLAPWPLFFFLASLGLLLSVTFATVLRANLVMVLVLIAFLSCIATSFEYRKSPYLEAFAFSYWIPAEASEEDFSFSLTITLCFAAGAWICWRLALFLFERRSQSAAAGEA